MVFCFVSLQVFTTTDTFFSRTPFTVYFFSSHFLTSHLICQRYTLLSISSAVVFPPDRRRDEAAREEAKVRRVCSESEELQKLEQQLKAAYLNKERDTQVCEMCAVNIQYGWVGDEYVAYDGCGGNGC